MTNLDDFDRSLATFLADGPTIAPEAPVLAAMAHARTTPRRWDPFAALRRDVMARPLGLGGGRAGLVFAGAVLIVASIGVALVGSRPQESIVPPNPSASPSPSANPTIGPSVEPSPSAIADVHLSLRETGGDPASIDIADRSGHLVSAVVRPLGVSEEPQALTATNVSDGVVRVSWPGSPCDTVHRLTIAADFGLTLDRPRCLGDAIAAFYAIELTFDQPVDAGAMDTQLFDGRPGSGLPSWIVTGISSGGGRFDLAIVDESASIELPEALGDTTGATDPSPALVALEQIDGSRIRFTWRGPTCATSSTLLIDASGTNWELQTAPCSTNTAEVVRAIDITFTAPRSADGISLSTSTATP